MWSMAICAEVHMYGFMRESGSFFGSSRKKGAQDFTTFTHTALTSVELLLDSFIAVPVFGGTLKT